MESTWRADWSGLWHWRVVVSEVDVPMKDSTGTVGFIVNRATIQDAAAQCLDSLPAVAPDKAAWFWWEGTVCPVVAVDTVPELVNRWMAWRGACEASPALLGVLAAWIGPVRAMPVAAVDRGVRLSNDDSDLELGGDPDDPSV